MEFVSKQINLKKIFLILIGMGCIIVNKNIVYSDTNNSGYISSKDFENSINLNSVEFHEYENADNLFDDFFGLDNPLNETSDKTNYQDLSLQIDSRNLRDLYKKKIKEMTESNKKEERKYENQWSFFNKEI